MSTIRGRGRALEISIDRRPAQAIDELREQLSAQPEFFRGSRGTANFGAYETTAHEIAGLRDMLADFGIALDGVSGNATLAPLAAELELAYLGVSESDVTVAPIARVRVAREPVALSEGARTLVADFAGARADLAARRTERATAAEPAPVAAQPVAAQPVPRSAPAHSAAVAPADSTHYHRGTLRGGQALHHLGNIVVIGDVNPGAELIAAGDVVVFGALRGVAHAGAQGDTDARVIALDMQPTQLRIATSIAASDGTPWPAGPAQAYITGERIAVVPHAAAQAGRREAAP